MTLLVYSEGEMESSINRILQLTKLKGKSKVVVHFPSEDMMEIFIRNLHTSFEEYGIELPVDIDAVFIVEN